MHFERRASLSYPEYYKDFYLVRTHGRFYAIPPGVDAVAILEDGNLFEHPAVLSAPSLPALQELIDAHDDGSENPERIGEFEGYAILRLRGAFLGVPREATPDDLNLAEERRRVGAISALTREELEAAIDRARQAQPVEFAGWLPIYKLAGNCGLHPQFRHTTDPPPGYRFTWSALPTPRPSRWTKLGRWLGKAAGQIVAGACAVPRMLLAFLRRRRGVSVRARLRVFVGLLRLFALLIGRGCKFFAVLKFIHTRHLLSQLLVSDQPGPVMLTSMPLTYGQNPWLIEIEDPTTLFYPLLHNGQTATINLAQAPYFPVVKALLEDGNCKAILTHMKSTARMVAHLFGSDVIRRKIVYAPLGVKLPARWQRHEAQRDDEPIDLLFINSWNQVPANFYFRGGLDVLEAFAILRERYPQLRLTLRSKLPPLADNYFKIIEGGWVRVIDRLLSADEMAELHASSHIFLLPAARIHIVSLLQAMSHGLAVVASDGWGMEEYITHDRNGLIVKGRYGKVSWADEQAGMLREDYEPLYVPDPNIVDGLVEAVSRLVEDRGLRKRLGGAARMDVQTTYSLARWNEGVKQALDQARSSGPASPEVVPRIDQAASRDERFTNWNGETPAREDAGSTGAAPSRLAQPWRLP